MDQRRPFELAGARRKRSPQELATMLRRLRLFSFVIPRPREAEGDSLQLALTVGGRAEGEALLERLELPGLLDEPWRPIRPARGPFAGTAVAAAFERVQITADLEYLHRPAVVIRLWNDDDAYEVSPALVDRAVAIEGRLIALGAGDWPRDTRRLAWITPERHPELYAAPNP